MVLSILEKEENGIVKVLGGAKYNSEIEARESYNKITELLFNSGLDMTKNLSAINKGNLGVNIQGKVADREKYNLFISEIRKL